MGKEFRKHPSIQINVDIEDNY